MSAWKRIDSSHAIPNIQQTDECIFAREYNARQGYQGETNQLILNFKKPPTTKNTAQWFYRERDVKRFAEEIATLFTLGHNYAITAIPSSTHKSDPLYTNRFEDAFSHLKNLRPNLNIVWPIELNNTMTAAHAGGSRNSNVIQGNYVWKSFPNGTPEVLFLCDDVVTTGAHFRAASDFLKAHGFNGRIIGLFWARTI